MLEYIAIAHFVIMVGSMLGFAPAKYDYEYKNYFNEECPLFSWFYIGIPFFIVVSCVIFFEVLKVNIIDIYKFFNFLTVVFTVIYTLIFMRLYSFAVIKEIKNVSNYIIERRPFFKFSALVFIYTISFFSSVITIYYTNYFFDFSKGEEISVKVSSSVESNKGDSSSNYRLFVVPPIGGCLNAIEVSEYTQKQIKTGDNIKVKVHKGLYGIRYVGKEVEREIEKKVEKEDEIDD